MRTEVYSWRVSAELKTELEREARRRKQSVSAVLERAALDLLSKGGSDAENDAEQLRLHQQASENFGAFSGGNARRAESARETLRKRLRRRK